MLGPHLGSLSLVQAHAGLAVHCGHARLELGAVGQAHAAGHLEALGQWALPRTHTPTSQLQVLVQLQGEKPVL